ncbi:class C sortase [Corynebacterium renale]|uniref:class C sortase n=1 Tax=Corynebacterium renale TaxID=1724 RepID=UPI0038B81720
MTQLNNWEQMRVAAQYTRSIDGANTSELEERYTSAQVYNSNHSDGPILDPWLNRISEDNTDYQNYLAELDTHDVMARLVIPGIKVDLPVYHGTSEKTLQKGVGHLYGSDLPVGGQGTHAVLTAHTGLTNATLFDNLDDVVKGDAIYLGVSGEKLKYVVDDIRVVLPHETNTLRPEAGKDQITLITCTPYGINSHSLLVTAQRVPMDSTEEEVFQTSGLQWAWWMWAMLAGALLIGILLFLWVRKTTKRHNDKLRSLADLKDGA